MVVVKVNAPAVWPNLSSLKRRRNPSQATRHGKPRTARNPTLKYETIILPSCHYAHAIENRTLSLDAPTPSTDPPIAAHVTWTRRLAVLSLLGLIAWGLAWELWLAPLRDGGSWWAIKVIPLCFPLAGLLKNRMYTYRWVSLLVWLYFTEGVVRAHGDKGWSAGLAAGQVLLCLVLFIACALHVRLRFRDAELLAQSPSQLP